MTHIYREKPYLQIGKKRYEELAKQHGYKICSNVITNYDKTGVLVLGGKAMLTSSGTIRTMEENYVILENE